MKKILLFVSVAGNVALLALVLSSGLGKKETAPPTASGGKVSGAALGVKRSAGPIDTSDINPADWKEVASGDLRTQMERLRAAGFPESVIRNIISAQLSEQYQARRNALRGNQPKAPYWQNEQLADPAVRAAEREISNEYTKQMNELFGTTAPTDDPVYLAQLRLQYGDLPREKIDQITQIQQDYSDLRQKIYDPLGTGMGAVTINPEMQARLNQLELEQKKDIAGILTPQEAEEYELRSGSTASSMRSNLAAFQPNEQEFRTIFKLQKAFDDEYNGNLMVALSPEAQREISQRRTEAQKQLIAEVVAALGPQRGAEYERSIDGNYQQIYRVVERLELPKETAAQVWDVQKDIQQKVNALRTAQLPNAAARNEQLALLQQEAEARVGAALGQRGLDVYRQYGGNWMQNIVPRPATPAAGARGGAVGGGGGGRGGF
jgi:hypothetical protein